MLERANGFQPEMLNENLYLISAGPEAEKNIEKLKNQGPYYYQLLNNFLENLSENYDVVIFDTAPAFNAYTTSAIYTSSVYPVILPGINELLRLNATINFTQETVYRVAAVDAAGQRKPLAVSANGAVMDLEVAPDGSTLYMSGSFTQINSSSRQRAGAVDLRTQKVTSFAPSIDDSMVRSITVAADNSAVAVGGSFTSVGGSSNGYGVAILEKDGSLRQSSLSRVIRNAGEHSGIMSLKFDSRGLYGVGYSQEGTFEGMFRADWSTGKINLMADCHGDTYDVLPTNDVIYIASHSHDCSNIGGFPERSDEGVYHHAVGFSSTATGKVSRNRATTRSEERRVGKECRSRWSPYH